LRDKVTLRVGSQDLNHWRETAVIIRDETLNTVILESPCQYNYNIGGNCATAVQFYKTDSHIYSVTWDGGVDYLDFAADNTVTQTGSLEVVPFQSEWIFVYPDATLADHNTGEPSCFNPNSCGE
jgi:sucrose-6-phosphate hydrolase SacC (GH32 family)